jgi:hypothetical protein
MAAATFFIPTPADIEQYRLLRRTNVLLNQRLTKTIPQTAIDYVGGALGILRGNKIILNTEDESSVFMDCCLHDWIESGKNLVRKYAETHALDPRTEEYRVLQGMVAAQYRLLIPSEKFPGAGVRFWDPLADEEIFVMDVGLSHSPLPGIAARVVPLRQYWITSGAGLPFGKKEFKTLQKALISTRLLEEPDLYQHDNQDSDQLHNQHDLAILCIRTLLKAGASEHIRYSHPEGLEQELAEDIGENRPSRIRSAEPAVGSSRNSACPCGSGQRYKRCCGAKPRPKGHR